MQSPDGKEPENHFPSSDLRVISDMDHIVDNEEPYAVNDWVLIEHGRWTRSVKIDEGSGEVELRMIDEENVLMWSDSKPEDVYMAAEV